MLFSRSGKDVVGRESDFGILQYADGEKHRSMEGCIKQRYSDFVVREIEKKEIEEVHIEDAIGCDLQEYLSRMCGKEYSERIIQKIDCLINKEGIYDCIPDENALKQVKMEVVFSKEERREVHRGLRQYDSRLSSKTDEDGHIIVMMKDSPLNKKRRTELDKQKRFVSCIMMKKNRSTMESLKIMSDSLRISIKNWSFYGNKDKRAVTVQRISLDTKVNNVTIERISGQKIRWEEKGIFLNDFTYIKDQLALGCLEGNVFEVIVRSLKEEGQDLESIIEHNIEGIQKVGFINYFGLQRFGTRNVSTCEIGLEILKKNYLKVIDLIMEHSSGESEKVKAGKDMWKERKPLSDIVRFFNKCDTPEWEVLNFYLKGNENDHLGAIKQIPYKERLLYLHSIQSYIWNNVVSRRIDDFGLQLLIGDIVLNPQGDPVYIDKHNINEYNIRNVVLPLPGSGILYPNNETRKYYDKIVNSELGLEGVFENKNHIDICIFGSYRKVVESATCVQWKLLNYEDDSMDLLQTDTTKPYTSTLINHQSYKKDSTLNTGLWISFALKSSCYATMAIREILKN